MSTFHFNVGDLLAQQARRHPEFGALVDMGTGARLNYAELNAATDRFANAAKALGLQKGDRVGLLLPNSQQYLQAFFGLAKLGVVSVPMNSRLNASELQYVGSNAGIVALVYGQVFDEVANELMDTLDGVGHWIRHGEGSVPKALDFAEICEQASADPVEPLAGDEDLLYLMYTSGTTGFPKGTIHTHNSALWAVLTLVGSGDYRLYDVYYNAMPLFHVGGLMPMIIAAFRCMKVIMEPGFDPMQTWQNMQKEEANSALLVPAMLLAMRMTYNPEVKLPHLRWIVSGASPVPVELIRWYQEREIPLGQIYGLTETGGPACLLLDEESKTKIGSTGRAMVHTQARIAGPDGKDCAPGESGEVLVKGPHLMQGYWDNPKATAESLVDGWLHTGDVGTMDEDGYVTIVDRIKDMIISGGENIYPAELENVLVGIDGVVEAAVIGAPSEQWGESPVAVVVKSDPELTEGQIINHCLEKLARFKRIAAVHFVEQLPRNPSGKVLKPNLREQFAQEQLP